MTTLAEKHCIVSGLLKIAIDLGLPCIKYEGDDPLRNESPLSIVGEDMFAIEDMTTLIVPALGPDMAEIYPDGLIKLLTLNVSSQSMG
jgi:hypothetical protein